METLGPALRDLIGCPTVKEAAILSTCQSHRGLFPRHRRRAGHAVARRLSRRGRRDAVSAFVHAGSGPGGAARVSRRQRARLDGVGRAADPRSDEARGEKCRGRRVARAGAHRLFRAPSRSPRTCAPHTDIGSASISMAAAAVRLAERIFPSIAGQHVLLDRRRRHDRPRRNSLRREVAEIHLPWPTGTLERGAQLAARSLRGCDRAPPSCRSASRSSISSSRRPRARCRSLARGMPRACDQGAAARADVHRRSGDSARCRARGGGARRRLSFSVDDLSNIIKDNLQVRVEAVREAEAMIAEQAASFLRWLEGARWCRRSPRCTGITTSFAPRSWNGRAACLAGGAAPDQVLEQLARGLTNKFCMPRRRRSTAPAKPSAPSCSRCCTTSTSFPTNLS